MNTGAGSQELEFRIPGQESVSEFRKQPSELGATAHFPQTPPELRMFPSDSWILTPDSF
jgi:hypothetical protein